MFRCFFTLCSLQQPPNRFQTWSTTAPNFLLNFLNPLSSHNNLRANRLPDAETIQETIRTRQHVSPRLITESGPAIPVPIRSKQTNRNIHFFATFWSWNHLRLIFVLFGPMFDLFWASMTFKGPILSDFVRYLGPCGRHLGQI